MQFKNIAAILLGVAATGALAGPVAQPDVAIEARADQAKQDSQAGQAQQAGQAKAGKQDYPYDDDDYNQGYYGNNGLDNYRYGNGYNNGRYYGNDRYGNGYNNGRYGNGGYGNRYPGQWDGDRYNRGGYDGYNGGRYGRGGYDGYRGGNRYDDRCPQLSCYAPNGCDGWNGFCQGGVYAQCPCLE